MNLVDSLHAHRLLKLPVAADLAGPDAAARGQGSPEALPSEPFPRRDDALGDAPLCFAQQGVWLLERFEPGSALHNRPAVFRFTGPLDPEALRRALNEIVRRHEVLRTSFQEVDDERAGGVPVQVIRPATDPPLPMVDLSRLGDPERRVEARRLALAEARQPFDLAQAPLLRTRLLRPDREEHALLVTAHDIVFDGWSAGVLLHELTVLYRAFSAGHPSPLSELPVQYADFAVWQRQRLTKGTPDQLLESRLAYWRVELRDLPVLELPCDLPRPALQSFRGTIEPLSLPAELGRRLGELAREQATRLATTLLAAFQVLLGRTSGQLDLAVGAVVAQRDRPELEAMVGLFANTVVLRGDLRGDPSFTELLARARDVVLGACAHGDLPFELLVEELEPERNLSQNPLVQVLFVMQREPGVPARELAPGLGVELGSVATGTVMYDLTLVLAGDEAGLRGALEYNTDLFDATTMRRMAGHFRALLAGLTADPEQRLSQLPQLSPAERQQLLVEWNDTRSEPAGKAPIPQRFEAQVERTPHAVAVMLANELAARPAEYLSYRELNRQANRLSHPLRALGVGPEVPVGIYLERSPVMVTAILAILKAGGLYVPLDPTYPRERLRFLIEDSGIPLILTRESLAEQLPDCSARLFYLEQAGPGAEENPPPETTVDNLAYLLYTSGSTGRPKGVACNHAGPLDLLAEFAARAPIAAGDRCSWWTSLNFDVSVYEIFSALLAGGSLCIVPEGVRPDGERFVAWLRGERIRSAYVTPSMLPELAKQVQQKQEQLALRRLLVGVEPIAETLLTAIREDIAGVRIINGYGPTEATICATLYNLRAPADGAREPRNTPIGRPPRNTEIYLLDRYLRPTPLGVPGELAIGGAGLARGYHHRPQRTAERFIPNPFSTTPGALLYRTGDLARTLPSGDLMFLGRQDFQVKVRGFRIELGEVEAAVGRHPAVRETVVVAAGEDSGDPRLVAYVVRESAGELDAGRLRAFLRERLPSHMVPSAVVFLDALPLTRNGKVDRRALPDPEPAAELAESWAAPRGPVEEILTGIWAEVLDRERVGIHDDFFEIGGHSLRATQVASRANAALGGGIGPQLLFEHPTVAELAAAVERLAAADRELPIETLGPEARRGPLPLSFAQERLWFLHQLQPEDTAYNVAFGLELTGALDPEALRRTLREILRRHEILRTTYAIVDEEPRQRISPPGDAPLPLVDLHALAPGHRREQLEHLMRHDEGRPFDLVRGPVFRTTLLRLAHPPERAEHVLFFSCHHIAFDGWSMTVLGRELAALYRAFVAGSEKRSGFSPLAPLPIQYADFACWQRRWLSGQELDRQQAWWRAELDRGQPLVRLPVDHPRPEGAASRAVRRHFTLSGATFEALRSLSRRRGATLFMTLAAVFQTLLHRHTGAEAVTVGTPIANRNRRELEGLIGFFVNTLVLRTPFRGDPPFVELLERVRQATLGAYAHQDLPFEKLVEALQPDRRAEPQPLFQVLFVLQNSPLPPLELPGLTLRPLIVQEGERERGALFDLTLGMVELGERLEGFLDFDATVFEAATIDVLLDHLRRLLEEIAADPERRVGNLSLLTESERRQLLERRSRADAAAPRPEETPEDPQATAAAAAKQLRTQVASRRGRLSATGRALLAQRLRGRSKKASEAAAIPRRPSQEPASLSFAQERLWFLDQLAPGTAVYNMPFPLRLPGRVEPAILAASCAEIRRRHEVLRATFRAVDGKPRMEFAPPRVDPVPLVDLAGLPASRRPEEARRVLTIEGPRPFDLARGPVLRVLLVRLGDDDLLLFNSHHIVFDAWSVDILTREFFILYRTFEQRRGDTAGLALEKLPIQYADFAHWQRQWLRGEVLDRQLGYWKKQLAGAPPVLELPWDRSRPAVQSFRGSWLPVAIPGDLAAALEALTRREEVTLFMTLLAAFKALLSRYTAQEDIVVGSPIAGRNRKEIEGLIGFFVNTLALRTRWRRDASFRELLAQVRQVAMDGFAHQDLPFERLVEELQPERTLGSNPLFQVMFALQSAPQGNVRMPGMTVNPLFAGTSTAKFDMTLILEQGASGLGGMLEYNTDLFDRSTMTRFLAHYECLLAGIVEDPERRFAELPWLGAAERHQLLVDWNATANAAAGGELIHELFERQAERSPEAVALVGDGPACRERWSYRELERRANQLAHHLRVLGVGPEARVGVCAGRSPQLVMALLGILKSGAAYVPLDPVYPPERLAFMLEDARVRVLVTEERVLDHLPERTMPAVCLDRDAAAIAAQPTVRPGRPADDDNLAYLIYTSGSTGRPKGVAIAHRSTVAMLGWAREVFSAEDLAGVLGSTSVCFDISVFEIFAPLAWGGRVILARDALEIESLAAAAEIRLINTVPSAMTELVRLGAVPASVRTVNLAGEVLKGALVERLYRQPTIRRVLNLYGPSEDTTYSTWARIERHGGEPTIGRPLAGTRACVLDRGGRPVALGVVGELSLGGAGLARGYLDRPRQSAERFVPDPFGSEAGARLYRTGDLCRLRPDAAIEFLGRIDHQVKVRGFRIELGEIEAILGRSPGVRECAVLARERRPGDLHLVAFLVAESGVREAERRAFLKKKLPEYMIPSAFELLDALPLTPSGKVDRRALAHRALSEREPAAGSPGPGDPNEELLAAIWAEVLGRERVGVHDNFFELGGHSLLATQVVSRIREAFRVEVPVQQLFAAPTVAGLTAVVQRLRREQRGIAAPPMRPVSRDRELPLSFAQQRLWFLDQFEPGSPAYNIPAAVRRRGALNPALLERIFNEVVRRHEALRTTFTATAGRPHQVIAKKLCLSLPLVELGRLPAAAREAEARHLAAAEALRPFDLRAGPLIRCTLLRLDAEDHAVLVTMHHIVSDGWSVGIFLRELTTLHEAFSQGRPSPLAELPLQYADFAHWQRQWLRGEVLEAELAFWKQMLDGAPPRPELPTDRPRPAIQTFRGSTRPVALSRDRVAALAALSRRQGATLYMTLVAAFQLLLIRTTGQDDVVVGSPIAGRNRREIEGMIGFFVNTLVLRTRLRYNGSFRELLTEVRRVTLDAYAHQDLPFERLVEELQPERDLSSTPLFQVMFILQNAPAAGVGMPGLAPDAEATTAKFDLTLSLQEGDAGASGGLEYNTDLFDDTTMRRLLIHFERLLAVIVEDPERRLAELPWLGAAERHQLLVDWNATAIAAPGGELIHELFERQAERTPEAVALVGGGPACRERWSYRELERRANQLAHHLRVRYAGPLGVDRDAEARVGVCAGRSPQLVMALLGILKSGAAYVPLDPGYPPERLAFMLEDARVRVLVTEERLLDHLPELTIPAVCLDRDAAAIAAQTTAHPGRTAVADNLAYLIYTSGSTGRPKGVAIAHRSTVAMLGWAREVFSAEDLAGVLGSTSVCFDISVFEIFAPLAWGGRVILARDALELESLPDAAEVRLINTVPSAMTELVRLGAVPASVRTVNLAGEVLKGALVERLYRQPTIRSVLNLYGPSEDTTYSTWVRIERQKREPTIGRPLAGTRAYVLDREGRPVALGVVGELSLGGAGLARGYLDRPRQTAERFVPDPFSHEAGTRLYRTGDLCRLRPDAAIEFLGRIDHQVKVRGFRIELGEIEAILVRRPGVRECAVLARERRPGDLQLVAYLVADPEISPDELRAGLGEKLPDYMIPTAFEFLDALPLNPSGKIDRRALGRRPLPERRVPAAATAAPEDPNEELLAGIWAEVLGMDRVGVRDNFFALGGHSLLATQVVSRIREALRVEVPVQRLFEAPTVVELAGVVRRLRRAGQAVAAPPMVPVARDQELPLSFAQQRLWFLDQLEFATPVYNLPAVVRLGTAVDAGVLERAFNEVVRRHEVLRTSFEAVDGRPRQVIAEAVHLSLPVVDLRQLPPAEREAEARRLAGAEARRLFDLSAAPLVRVALLRLAAADHLLLVTMHHIVSDGWSIRVFQRELAMLVEAFSRGKPSPLSALPIQYADFADWQRRWLAGKVLEAELDYWRAQLGGAPPRLELPADHPRPAVQSFRGRSLAVVLSEPLSEALATLSRRHGATLFMTLLAAFQTLLGRWSGQQAIVVGTPIAGRTHKEIEALIGFFVNTLVLRTDLSGDPSFEELLERVRGVALDAYAHQDVPFERLVEELEPDRDLGATPLFQVMLVLQNAPGTSPGRPGPDMVPLSVEGETTKFDLTLSLQEDAAGVSGALAYSTDLFDPTTAQRLRAHFKRLLAGIVEDPGRRLSELELLSAAERQALLREWNDTATGAGFARPVHELLAMQVAERPEAVAVVCGERVVSYGELGRRAAQLARQLGREGGASETVVALCMERSVELVVGMLGIVAAGGAYLPLDPSYPTARLAFMLADSGVRVVLTRERLVARLREALPEPAPEVIALDPSPRPSPLGGRSRKHALLSPRGEGAPAHAEQLAYVIYTSGSTGTPKGVELRHRGLSNLVGWYRRRCGITATDRVSQVAGPSFDGSVKEFWPVLAAGGSLHIPDEATRSSPAKLLEWLASERIDLAYLPTPLAQTVLAEPRPADMALRALTAGGDRLRRPPDENLPWALINLYGPTENTVVTTAGVVGADEPSLPSIGRPIDNTEVYAVDRALRPVPVGVAGELVIRGIGLARGYGRRPALTAERFVPDPFSQETSGRLYRTGDLVRWRRDGRIGFLARIDHQVKIRGYRIEPGEIEAVLAAHPAVRDAVVLAREEAMGEKRLVAYLVPEAEMVIAELREFLRQRLPESMVPAAFVELGELPLLPNGKVDRTALGRRPLPEPGADLAATTAAPRDTLELRLTRIWEELLGVARIGIRTRFFDLGGHSLLAVRLMARIRHEFGRDLPLAILFQEGTVEHLAAILRRQAGEMRRKALVAIRPEGSAPPFFCVHPVGGNVLCYGDLSRHLGSDQPFYGLQVPEREGELFLTQIGAMAQHYVEAMREVQPEGPYRLGGWSMGGVVAFEMARRLVERNQPVECLVLIDSRAPAADRARAPEPDDVTLAFAFARDQAGILGAADLPVSSSEELKKLATAEEILSFLYERLQAARLLPPGLDLSQIGRLFEMFKMNIRATERYSAPTYPGRLVLLKASEPLSDEPQTPDFGWGSFAEGGVEVDEIPGNHYSILRETHVQALADRLRKILDSA